MRSRQSHGLQIRLKDFSRREVVSFYLRWREDFIVNRHFVEHSHEWPCPPLPIISHRERISQKKRLSVLGTHHSDGRDFHALAVQVKSDIIFWEHCVVCHDQMMPPRFPKPRDRLKMELCLSYSQSTHVKAQKSLWVKLVMNPMIPPVIAIHQRIPPVAGIQHPHLDSDFPARKCEFSLTGTTHPHGVISAT